MQRDNSEPMQIGIAVIASFVVGLGACVLAIVALGNAGDYVAAAICLVAAALSFGLLTNALLRA